MIWPVLVAYSLMVVLPASVSVRRRSAPFSSVFGSAPLEFASTGIAPPNSARALALAHNTMSAIAEAEKTGEKQGFGMDVRLAIGGVEVLLRCPFQDNT